MGSKPSAASSSSFFLSSSFFSLPSAPPPPRKPSAPVSLPVFLSPSPFDCLLASSWAAGLEREEGRGGRDEGVLARASRAGMRIRRDQYRAA
eukprot:2440236-Rhodomonas_salina.1